MTFWELALTGLMITTMPELPDIVVYVEALRKRIQGERLEKIRLRSAFLLRTALPPLDRVNGLKIKDICRVGKRIVFSLEDDYYPP